MTIKTVGVPGENGKDFRITFEGVEYIAIRSGQKFTCNGFRGSLKEIKAKIVNEWFNSVDEPEDIQATSTWDCVDPCALLIAMLPESDLGDETVLNTLDSYGWIVDGKVDSVRAERLLAIASK